MIKKTTSSNWNAPKDSILPDFIIGGSMKSGTTTLHTILNEHPKIFIPPGEVNFFDIDDIMQHSDFVFYNKGKRNWYSQDMDHDPDTMWNWYSEKFKGQEDHIKGEDSTAYLSSRIAAKRISLQTKEIKLIFVLRHPTKRTYSQYYHMLRTGRATYSFENTIRFNPRSILERSLYLEQLEWYYKYFPSDRIKVILFEDMVNDTKAVIEDACNFLNVDFNEIDPAVFDAHSNKAKLPVSRTLQIFKNRIFRSYGNLNFITLLPNSPVKANSKKALVYKVFNKAQRMLVPVTNKKKPQIRPETKALLDAYYKTQLEGLDELVGKDILHKWYPKVNNEKQMLKK